MGECKSEREEMAGKEIRDPRYTGIYNMKKRVNFKDVATFYIDF